MRYVGLFIFGLITMSNDINLPSYLGLLRKFREVQFYPALFEACFFLG